MKKLLSVVVAMVICTLTFITAFADAAPFQTYTALVNPGGTTIYVTDEETNEEKPVKVPEFSKITVLSYSNYEDENGKKATYFVNYGEYSGNIYNDDFYVSDFTATGELFAPVNYPASYKPEEFFATVTEEGSLNERTGPSTLYEKKGKFSNGTVLKCHYKYNGWAFVSEFYGVNSSGKAGFQIEEGWVSLSGLKIIDKNDIPKHTGNNKEVESKETSENTSKTTETTETTVNEVTTVLETTISQNEAKAVNGEVNSDENDYSSSASTVCIIIAVVIAIGSGVALILIEKKKKLKKAVTEDTELTENIEVPEDFDEDQNRFE